MDRELVLFDPGPEHVVFVAPESKLMRFLWRRDSLLLGSGPGFLRQKAHSFRDLSVREWLQQLSLVVAEHGWINPLAGPPIDRRVVGLVRLGFEERWIHARHGKS